MKKTFFLLLISLFVLFSNAQDGSNRVSASLLVEKLSDGKVVKVGANIYIDLNELKMVTHYLYPKEYMLISNNKGEIKFYFPDKNEVFTDQSKSYAAQNELIYYLLTTKEYNFGVDQVGCKLKSTTYEDNHLVTMWEPPLAQQENFKEMKFVYKNNLPVFSAYMDKHDSVVKKTYYYDYQFINRFPIPRKITEYLYLKNGTKIISRKTYTNLKSGFNVNHTMFDFKIPDDATIVE